jgi:hypothetical protein
MRSTQKILIAVAVLVMVIALGVIIGLMGGGTSPAGVPEVVDASAPTPAPTPPPDRPAPRPLVSNPRPPAEPVRLPPIPRHNTNGGMVSPALAPVIQSGTIITNWEDKLNEILASDDDDTNKSKVLLEMFPHLPEDGQVEVAEHLLNLMAGQDYTPLAQILKDPKLPEAVQDVILSDALNWPNTTKLPLLLEVAQNPEHPKHEEALDWLGLYVDGDHGTNWDQWGTALRDYIKNNPEE